MAAEIDARWLPIAVSADILNGTVVPARLPTGAIAVWRSASGQLYANADRCPHRGMRLSHGFVRGDTLSCIYHGWRFGTDGACQKIPAHPTVQPPLSINCGPLSVVEQNGVVWSATSKPANAPDNFEGYEALRSLVIAASPEAISLACGGALVSGAMQVQLGGKSALLVLNPHWPDAVFVVVLAPSDLPISERLAISAGIEGLRRTAEAEGVAA